MYIEYYEQYYKDVALRFSVNTEKILALVFFFMSVMFIMKHKEEIKILNTMYKADVFEYGGSL
jgi:hypothetical protein